MSMYKYSLWPIVIMFCILTTDTTIFGSSSSNMARDLASVSFQTDKGTWIRLNIPDSIRNDQCARRLYGTRAGIGGMFQTLYFEKRRTESYEAAVRELSLQPASQDNPAEGLSAILEEIGIATEDAQLILDIVKHGSRSIKKNYVRGGALTADVRNRLAKVGRKLNAASKNHTFAKVCLAFENIRATTQITDVLAGAFLLNALATDIAEQRLNDLKSTVLAAKHRGDRVDPALEKGIAQARTNIAVARDKIGSLVVSVNDRIDEITDSALNLAGSLAEISAKLSPAVAMWVGAPLMTYNTLRGISNQWETAQDAVTVATVTELIRNERLKGRDNDTLRSMHRYGEYAFYSLMERAFSVGGAKFKDFLSPGHTNKDWATYYGAKKRSILNQ
ncbi:hypothetical protein ACFL3Q_03490 [Planctomycetota bacterium]